MLSPRIGLALNPQDAPFSYGQPRSLRNRALMVALVLLIELLILLGFMTLKPFEETPAYQQQSVVVQVRPLQPPKIAKQEAPRKDSGSAPKPVFKKPEAQPKVQPPPLPKTAPKMVIISHDDFASSDLGSLPSRGDGNGDKGKGAGAVSGPGEGPGGVKLYNAQWYVEPRQGELALYLPRGAPPNSWATIACRTIPAYHVEDCVALSESPPGSGLARAMRQASWQFLVRPPSANGRPLVGTWVRIRFEWTAANNK